MRTGFVISGAVLLIVGVAVFLVAAVGLGQASVAFLNCLNGNPNFPMYGVPTACTDAMSAVSMYEGFEILGGLLGVVGFVLLIVGVILQPERPAMAPYYPPPVYAPPYTAPPQGPQPPPPQP